MSEDLNIQKGPDVTPNGVTGGEDFSMLEIRNITKIYRSKTGESVKALDNVSIKFPETGMIFILGKSGSGKSTLLNVIGGLDGYDSGEFVIMGKSSKDFVGSDFDAYRNTFIGFIFQEYNILDDFSVGANIGLALELQGKKATSEAIESILSQVDLAGYAHRKPNELSGGQKQRIAIARALVKEPQIIMADEPTGALDSNTGKQVFDTLKELSKQKLVLIVSHDRDFAERYADRIIELKDGTIIRDDTKRDCPGVQINEGVQKSGENILRIRGGYQLTPADVKMINEYLALAEGDLMISGDTRVNAELRSAARIAEDGSTTTFDKTDADADVPVKRYDGKKTRFIRSRLPMKNAVKMGSSGLKHKKFRLFMTILLSFVAFAMFGLANSMAAYEKISAATQSIIESDIKAAAVTLSVRTTSTWTYNGETNSNVYHSPAALNDEDIAWLEAQTGLDFVPVFTGTSGAERYDTYGFSVQDLMSAYANNTVFNATVSGLTTITEAQLNTAGYQLTGRLPENENEIAITEFIVRQFQEYGFTNEAFGEAVAKGSVTAGTGGATDIIGKHITFSRIGWNSLPESERPSYTIVGVIDTHFDYARYDAFLPKEDTRSAAAATDTGILDLFLSQEVEYERDYGFHALGYTVNAAIENLTSYLTGNGSKDISTGMWASNGKQLRLVALRRAEIDGDAPDELCGYNSVSEPENIDRLKVKWFDPSKSTLAANEILIHFNTFTSIIPNSGVEVTFDADAQTAFVNVCKTAYGDAAWDATNVDSSYRWRLEQARNNSADPDAVPAAIKEYVGTYYGIDMPANVRWNEIESALQFLGEFYEGGSNTTYTFYRDNASNWLVNLYAYDEAVRGEVWNNAGTISQFQKDYNVKNSEWEPLTAEEKKTAIIEYFCNRYYNNVYNDLDFAMKRIGLYQHVTGLSYDDLLDRVYFEIRESGEGGGDAALTTTPYKVVGIFGPRNASNNTLSSDLVVSGELYQYYTAWEENNKPADEGSYQWSEERAEHADGIWGFAIAAVNAHDSNAIETLVRLSYAADDEDNPPELLFELNNAVMYTLSNFNGIIEILSKVFLWVGLGLAIFASFLLMNFISISISYKKREIGILRAVGARSSDVFKIFFSEAFIIAFINFVLAMAASIVTVTILNSYMRNSGINITLLRFGPAQALLMLGISVAVAVISSFLPVWRIARRKPIDAIRDR